jgi:hypothetical protein
MRPRPQHVAFFLRTARSVDPLARPGLRPFADGRHDWLHVHRASVLISSVGVSYQIIDFRRRAARDAAQPRAAAYPGLPGQAAYPAHPVYSAPTPTPYPPSAMPLPPTVAPPPVPTHGNVSLPRPVAPRAVRWVRVLLAVSTALIGLAWGLSFRFQPDLTSNWPMYAFDLFILVLPSVAWATTCSIMLGGGLGWARYPTVLLSVVQAAIYSYEAINELMHSHLTSVAGSHAVSSVALLSVLASLVTVALLLAPAANAYFRDMRSIRRAPAVLLVPTTQPLERPRQ